VPTLSDSSLSPRQRGGSTFTLFASIVLSGLAAGALWCLLSLGIEHGIGLLIVPLALAIGVYFRWLGYRGLRGAGGAIAAVLIAFVYAQYLFAAVRVAQMLGFPLRSTLFTMDAGMAWQVSRGNLGALDLLSLLVACALVVAVTRKEKKMG
jgi:hypothetical protein